MGFWIVKSFIIGFFGSFLIEHYGYSWGLIDAPNKRSSHRLPIPKGAGIGILFGFVISAIWFGVSWIIWVPAFLLSLISLLGDFREIAFGYRLGVQLSMAAVISGFIYFERKAPVEIPGLSVLLMIFGIFYLTTTANYFNFMDGINGIAGLTGIIAFSSYGILGLIRGKDIAWASVSLCIASACLGFLPLNFPKAKVFMGDVGSILLGFLYATVVLDSSDSLIDFIFLSSFILPFYFDEVSTLIIRIKDHEILTRAHRRHIYQILANQAGMSHTSVTVMYGVSQIISIVIASLMKEKGIFYLTTSILILFVLYFIVGLFIRNRWEGRELIN